MEGIITSARVMVDDGSAMIIELALEASEYTVFETVICEPGIKVCVPIWKFEEGFAVRVEGPRRRVKGWVEVVVVVGGMGTRRSGDGDRDAVVGLVICDEVGGSIEA